MDAVAAIGWEVLDRFDLGPLRMSPHGVGIALGYLAGSWWLLREGKVRGLNEDDISSVLLRALIGAILGARFFYVLAHFSEFDTYVDMLKIWQGGISLIGGIFGAIIAAYPFMRKHRMGFLRTMDSAAIGLAFGILFGRVGDLIIGDHLGKPTSWLLAFVYKGGNLSGYDCSIADVCRTTLSGDHTQIIQASRAELLNPAHEVIQSGIGVHQTALYDFISTFFLFGLLVWLSRKSHRQGFMIAVFALWYGAMRIVTDFLRVDKRFFGLTGSQWASVAVASIAAFALLKWMRAGRIEASSDAATGADVLAAVAGPAPPPAAPVATTEAPGEPTVVEPSAAEPSVVQEEPERPPPGPEPERPIPGHEPGPEPPQPQLQPETSPGATREATSEAATEATSEAATGEATEAAEPDAPAESRDVPRDAPSDSVTTFTPPPDPTST